MLSPRNPDDAREQAAEAILNILKMEPENKERFAPAIPEFINLLQGRPAQQEHAVKALFEFQKHDTSKERLRTDPAIRGHLQRIITEAGSEDRGDSAKRLLKTIDPALAQRLGF